MSGVVMAGTDVISSTTWWTRKVEPAETAVSAQVYSGMVFCQAETISAWQKRQ